MDIVALVEEFGFTTVMVVGLGYFVYYVWFTITKTIDPAVGEMKKTIIRLTDQLRLLDQDMIRLQQKINTVLELKEENKLKDDWPIINNCGHTFDFIAFRWAAIPMTRHNKMVTVAFVLMVLTALFGFLYADEMTHSFKNPSFSGVGTSSHYLTIENQEFNRKHVS